MNHRIMCIKCYSYFFAGLTAAAAAAAAATNAAIAEAMKVKKIKLEAMSNYHANNNQHGADSENGDLNSSVGKSQIQHYYLYITLKNFIKMVILLALLLKTLIWCKVLHISFPFFCFVLFCVWPLHPCSALLLLQKHSFLYRLLLQTSVNIFHEGKWFDCLEFICQSTGGVTDDGVKMKFNNVSCSVCWVSTLGNSEHKLERKIFHTFMCPVTKGKHTYTINYCHALQFLSYFILIKTFLKCS